MKVDTTPIKYEKRASVEPRRNCRYVPRAVFVVRSMSVRTISLTPVYASSIPKSRMRWAMDCDAHTATTLLSVVSNSLLLPSFTFPSEAPVTRLSMMPITSLTPHDSVFSRPMATYIGNNKNDAIKLVRAIVLM